MTSCINHTLRNTDSVHAVHFTPDSHLAFDVGVSPHSRGLTREGPVPQRSSLCSRAREPRLLKPLRPEPVPRTERSAAGRGFHATGWLRQGNRLALGGLGADPIQKTDHGNSSTFECLRITRERQGAETAHPWGKSQALPPLARDSD